MRKSEIEARLQRLEAAGGVGSPLTAAPTDDFVVRLDALDCRVAEVERLLREAFEANEANGKPE